MRELATLRTQIDAIDEAIINLVKEREALALRAQIARLNANGSRADLTRENQVRERYKDALGSGWRGPLLADTILQLCKGGWL